MQVIDRVLSRLGLVRKSEIDAALDFARNVSKRLDEHRELVESISGDTDLFDQKSWHIGHMATQDDYLMRLFYLRHGCWPRTDTLSGLQGYVRARPDILGQCSLPEFVSPS